MKALKEEIWSSVMGYLSNCKNTNKTQESSCSFVEKFWPGGQITIGGEVATQRNSVLSYLSGVELNGQV